MPIITRKYIHEVTPRSNLDLILRGAIRAFNRFTDTLGHGFEILALALSTGEDNSEEIREQAKQIRASREALQQAIDRQQGDVNG